MRTKILGFGLSLLGRKMDGYKTKAAGVAFIALSLVGFVSIMFPDQGLPEMGITEAMLYFATGLGVLGGADKVEKLKNAIQNNTQG